MSTTDILCTVKRIVTIVYYLWVYIHYLHNYMYIYLDFIKNLYIFVDLRLCVFCIVKCSIYASYSERLVQYMRSRKKKND